MKILKIGGVITICKTAKKVSRSTQNLSYIKYILEKLMIHANLICKQMDVRTPFLKLSLKYTFTLLIITKSK